VRSAGSLKHSFVVYRHDGNISHIYVNYYTLSLELSVNLLGLVDKDGFQNSGSIMKIFLKQFCRDLPPLQLP
jgi:hypothetical protein